MNKSIAELSGKYDVIIIGAGPAGMFAAHELAGHDLKVLVIDRGKDIDERRCTSDSGCSSLRGVPGDIMCGVGGAGTFSDGTLNLRPDIGGDLSEFTGDAAEAWDLVEYVDRFFLHCGATENMRSPSGRDVEDLRRRAASVGASFIEIRQRHIGTDNAPGVIGRFKHELDGQGIDFLLCTEVADLWIEAGACRGVLLKTGGRIESGYTLLCPGRSGGGWVSEMVEKHSIDAHYAGVDLGVRVEVPAIVMDPVTGINRDPKFHILTRRYDDFVRTFCTNERGFVVKEDYGGFIATNGHSMHSTASENTNFAFLVRVELTKPIENTIKYARSVAKLATTIGGGKPVLQRMGDLRRGRRSTAKRLSRNPVVNTLKDVTPGDISMAMPHRVVMDIIEGLETLDRVIPGVASDSTLLYVPEVKFYSMRIQVDRDMQSSISNLFAAGDGAGLSRDIVNASATGVLAGRGILRLSGKRNTPVFL
jgi:uncharacterized FAD-dependent dehydrogenase